ncbi:MAG: methyltransferase domain-containing protein [Rhizobiaceae bacterium]|nr:methyltransferase domain-containing protein [Rhizobiaceae bacterium]
MSLTDAPSGHAALMDGVYRHQRHIYDLTRKYYLLGRDRLIAELDVPEGGSVLEIGCGTGRNLLKAMNQFPNGNYNGLDISEEMLATARASLARRAPSIPVSLAAADATGFDAHALFGVEKFDRVYISYALSMIPDWRRALSQAADCVAEGGSLHIVDFGQQERLPSWFRAALRGWLAKFHVEPRAGLFEAMQSEAARIAGRARCMPLYRGYAWYAVLSRDAEPNAI